MYIILTCKGSTEQKNQKGCLILLWSFLDASGLLRAVTQFSHLAADTIVNGAATSHSAPTDQADRERHINTVNCERDSNWTGDVVNTPCCLLVSCRFDRQLSGLRQQLPPVPEGSEDSGQFTKSRSVCGALHCPTHPRSGTGSTRFFYQLQTLLPSFPWRVL